MFHNQVYGIHSLAFIFSKHDVLKEFHFQLCPFDRSFSLQSHCCPQGPTEESSGCTITTMAEEEARLFQEVIDLLQNCPVQAAPRVFNRSSGAIFFIRRKCQKVTKS